jgi:transcriptional antiterminator NusG
LGQIDRGSSTETIDIPFQIGDKVKVIDGPFSDFTGVVDEISPEKSKIRVMVGIFGRSTPVELDVLQVEAITSEE